MVDQDWSKNLTTAERLWARECLNLGQGLTEIHFKINLKRNFKKKVLVEIEPVRAWLSVLNECVQVARKKREVENIEAETAGFRESLA